jgi:Putative zinc-finger
MMVVEGRLAPGERSAIDEHLDLCPECRTLVHALRPENHRSSETSRRDGSSVASRASSPNETTRSAPSSETTRQGSSGEPGSSIDRALASALLSPVEALGVATTVLRNPDSVATATVRPVPGEATASHGSARPRTRVWVGAGVLAVLASIGAIAALTHRPAVLDPAPSSPASSPSSVVSPAPLPPHPNQPMPAASAEPSAAPPSASVVRAAPSPEPRAPAGARRLPAEASPAPAPSRPAKAGPWDHL